MSFAKIFKNSQELWPKVSLLLSISFLVLSLILLILGNQLLNDSRSHILDQRLVLAQLVANHVDRSLDEIINGLQLTRRFADFDPLDPDLTSENQVLTDLYNQSEYSILQVVFLDINGEIVITYPPASGIIDPKLFDLTFIPDPNESQGAFVATPWKDLPTENLVTAISIPIYAQNNFLGWLSCVVDLDETSIKSLLADAVTQDHTAHAILVDGDGRSLISTFDLPFLSPGEHQTFYRRAMAQDQAIIEEVLFELDLPGEPPGHHHIMAFVPLKNADWGVSVGGDVINETFAAPYRLFLWLTAFFVVSIIAIWGGTLLSTKRLLEPVQKTTLKFDLSRQIADAKDWDTLTALVVRMPSMFMPVSDARLLISDNHSNVRVVSEWSSGENSQACSNLTRNAQICETCALAKKTSVISLASCAYNTEKVSLEQLNSFCFPLVHQEALIGTLHFCLPHDVSITDYQTDILTSVASDIAIALESAQLQKASLKQAEITQTEQSRIFRTLHDTIGQNISYLHLMLDQYSNKDTSISVLGLQQDIERMRDVADQAYHQMRNMLKDLNPETQTDLVAALRARVKSVAERSNFKFDMDIEGKPMDIPQSVKRRVLFICYEALNNIEKHARAKNVSINLVWGNSNMIITIKDDGVGINLDGISPADHFGLRIMEDRAKAIDGKLAFTSKIDEGTTMTLRIPLL